MQNDAKRCEAALRSTVMAAAPLVAAACAKLKTHAAAAAAAAAAAVAATVDSMIAALVAVAAPSAMWQATGSLKAHLSMPTQLS